MDTIKSALALAVAINLGTCFNQDISASAFSKDRKGVESSVIIKASPATVFEHIQQSRTMEPARRKLVSHQGNIAIIDEKFDDVPMIGKVKCTYREVETQNKRVEYKLISSDKFKSFEGVWDLSETPDGDTLVKLSAFTEPKFNIPFASAIGNPSALRDVQRRLNNLKTWTEKDSNSKNSSEATKQHADSSI